MNLLSINWNEIINTIDWTETILPGLFTLTGAALGAFLAGRYAVNAVTNQLNYDKNNKRIDILDNNLKISNEFTTNLHLILDEIKKFEDIFLSNETEKISTNQKNFIDSIKELKSYIDKKYDYLSKLPINNIPYENFKEYQNVLYDLRSLKAIISIMLNQKYILNMPNTFNEKLKINIENDIENTNKDFIEYKNTIKKAHTEIYENHINSHMEYKRIKEKINKIIKN